MSCERETRTSNIAPPNVAIADPDASETAGMRFGRSRPVRSLGVVVAAALGWIDTDQGAQPAHEEMGVGQLRPASDGPIRDK